ncbi:hypothetical protein C1H46_018645 [Malus baccata]|uniref:Uncharacterized protein n=1 Tax=Malus baccata TaxID=106549 RepID=A0A540MAF1_MALBA|nr:hypothetical protein C1H46_018645 [Malus baccata]
MTWQKWRGCAIGSWGGYGGSQHASSTNFASPVTSPPRLCINVRVLRGLKNQVSGILFFSISPPPPPSSLSSSSSKSESILGLGLEQVLNPVTNVIGFGGATSILSFVLATMKLSKGSLGSCCLIIVEEDQQELHKYEPPTAPIFL